MMVKTEQIFKEIILTWKKKNFSIYMAKESIQKKTQTI
jgi:hypothetical protein